MRADPQGVFVLQSHAFPPLIPLSSFYGISSDLEAAKAVGGRILVEHTTADKKHLIFPQALIQGALTRLGMNAVVTLESSGLPQCELRPLTLYQANVRHLPNPHGQSWRYCRDTIHLHTGHGFHTKPATISKSHPTSRRSSKDWSRYQRVI